jgi:hypothetical protein
VVVEVVVVGKIVSVIFVCFNEFKERYQFDGVVAAISLSIKANIAILFPTTPMKLKLERLI